MSEKVDLYTYLRTQFSNLDEAIIFARKWFQEMEQELPKNVEESEDGYTMRAMAHHISLVLEGREVSAEDWYKMDMNSTVHGLLIYWEMSAKQDAGVA